MILDAIATLFGTITYSSLEWPVLGRGLACSVDFLLLLFSWDLFFGSTAHCVKGCHGQKAWCGGGDGQCGVGAGRGVVRNGGG